LARTAEKESAPAAVLAEIVKTVPLSNERRERLSELMAGGDVHATQ